MLLLDMNKLVFNNKDKIYEITFKPNDKSDLVIKKINEYIGGSIKITRLVYYSDICDIDYYYNRQDKLKFYQIAAKITTEEIGYIITILKQFVEILDNYIDDKIDKNNLASKWNLELSVVSEEKSIFMVIDDLLNIVEYKLKRRGIFGFSLETHMKNNGTVLTKEKCEKLFENKDKINERIKEIIALAYVTINKLSGLLKY